MAEPPNLSEFPVHLASDGAVVALPRFTGDGAWYAEYEQRHEADGPSGRLVSWHSFDASWDSWEVHPAGEELVLCVNGRIELIQELDGGARRVVLGPGEWAVNPAGVWHTADVAAGDTASCVFITSGLGTQGRPR